MRVLGLIRDLMFRSKIDAAAESLGVEVAYVSTLELLPQRCADINPTMVMVDLSEKNFAPEATMAALCTCAPGVKVIGFASHVDLKALAGAREAGFQRVLSRQEFAAQIPELLRPTQE
jgi:DNA-binding NarL/FixJ family response regulator